MARRLTFNLDSLSQMKKACEDCDSSLTQLSSDLSQQLETLKEDWETPAGKKFFSDLETDWMDQVNRYVEVTHALEALLQAAIDAYTPIQEQARALIL